jgi:hypothetical protein
MILVGLLVLAVIAILIKPYPARHTFAALAGLPVLAVYLSDPARRERRVSGWILYFIALSLVDLVFVDLSWVGVALAPVTIGLLALLLPRQDTGPAARDWGQGLLLVLLGVFSMLGLLGLLTIPVPIGWAAVPVLGGLIGYHAGRRAGLMQGQSEKVATGIGIVIGLSGGILLGPSGGPGVMLVIGLVGGLLAANLAPPPPPVARRDTRAMLVVYQQLVFVAPLTYALLWLAQTFFT